MIRLKDYITNIKYTTTYFDVEDDALKNPFCILFACLLVCSVFQLWSWSIGFLILIIINEIYQAYHKVKQDEKQKEFEQKPKFIQSKLEHQLRQAAHSYCKDYLKLNSRIISTEGKHANLDNIVPMNVNVYRLMKNEYDRQNTQNSQNIK